MSRRAIVNNLASERGIALVMVMMLLMLTSAILAGFLVTASGDMRLRAVDRNRTQALYAAHAGLEKLTADLGDLFAGDFSPDRTQIAAIEADRPTLQGVTFEAADGLGYDIAFNANGAGNPTATSGTISSGPFQGFIGLLTPYTMTVTSRSAAGAESRLQRTMQTVSIPVFQFGVFSETDLTFSANGVFSFGGRVHTNGNLFLAAAAGGTLYLRDKVTAFGEIVRTHLANSRTIGATHDGTVMVNRSTANCPGTSSPYTACRPLAANQGSIVGNVPSAANAQWTNIFGTYNGYLRNHLNGVTNLQLPLVSDAAGGTPIDLIRRGVPDEEDLLLSQRLYAQASVRILLADSTAELLALPDVSADAPISLAAQFGAVSSTPFNPPFATAPATAAGCNNGNCVPAGTPLIGGFIKVEYRNAANNWVDVTTEWLNRGFTRRNIDRATMRNTNTSCNEPNPNAILRLQRIRQNPSSGTTDTLICNTIPSGGSNGANAANPATPTATDFWPNTLYDTREAFNRDNAASIHLNMAGVMHYVDLDVNNLRLWLADSLPGLMAAGAGNLAVDENGYAVYFSDRRGNRNGAGNSTGEFGWEDIVNGANAAGTPNNTLNDGEDVNSSGTFETYGATPHARSGLNVLGSDLVSFLGWQSPFNSAATPYSIMNNTNANAAPNSATYNNPRYKARSNPPLFFRRALKLTNGGLGQLPVTGLTIASENPVYVEGHYNSGPAAWGNGAPAAIMADSITLLSAAWNTVARVDVENDDPTSTRSWMGHGDTRSFYTPNDPGRREAENTWYRFAALAGKTRNWSQAWESGSFGTDGGVHNFLRLIEDWNEAGRSLNYKGSVASFYYSRQATGLFRCCDDVYQLPATRNLSFDTNFLNPALLPPKTPMFRDINTTGFVQITRRQ